MFVKNADCAHSQTRFQASRLNKIVAASLDMRKVFDSAAKLLTEELELGLHKEAMDVSDDPGS
jgi:hypothetical protein